MNVAFLCESSPELGDFDMSSFDWVVVNLSPERVALLRQQIELANEIRQKDPTLREMQFKMNDLEVYDGLPRLDGEDGEKAFDEAYDKDWAVLPDELDLSQYESLELKVERFCVRPARGKRPATFQWLIHIEGETGPVRTVKWRMKDLEKALRKAEARFSSQKEQTQDAEVDYGFEPEWAACE